MLNLKATYQKTKYDYKAGKNVPEGEPETVTIITVLSGEDYTQFLAVTSNGRFFADSIECFTLAGEGWLTSQE